MKTHTNEYKKAIATPGRQIKTKITYILDDVTKEIEDDKLYSVNVVTNTELLKSVMKQLEFESSVKLLKGISINVKNGVLVGDEYEYIDFGNYEIYSIEENLETKSFIYTCYDKMLKTMINYEQLNVTYPINVREYINAIATKCGLEFAKSNLEFSNYNVAISKDNFETGSYTFRDVLDYLSQIIGGWFYINSDDKLDIKYATETNETFSKDYLKNINVNFSKKYGPINSVVFARSLNTDNIYRKNQESIDSNGLTEIKISDNPFLEGDDRENFIQAVFDKLNGLEFYIMDVNSTGITYLDFGDLYGFEITNDIEALKSGTVKSGVAKARGFTSGIYKCLILNDELHITQGLEETIYSNQPKLTETDYKKASLTDSDIKNAIIQVNKSTAEIELKVNKDEVISSINLSPETITISADKVNITASDILNIISNNEINLTSKNITINSDNFSVDADGKISSNSGEIGGIEINNQGLFNSGQNINDGFGLWKSNLHNDGTGYIIFHSGANNTNIGGAPFKIYQDGKVVCSKLNVTGGSISIARGNYYFNMGVSTGNPNVSGLNVGSYGVKANSDVAATGFAITDSDTGKSGTFILRHSNGKNVVYLTFTGGILTAFNIV